MPLDGPVDRRTQARKEPPICAKCSRQHWHFANCEDAPEWVPPRPMRIEYRPHERAYRPLATTPLERSRALLGFGVNTSVIAHPKKKGS